MVALSAFITRFFIERSGFADVGWNLGHYKSYLAVLLFCVLLWLGPPLAALSLGKLGWNHDAGKDALVVSVLSMTGMSVLAGFGEEFGWRAYLVPRLLFDRRMARGVLVIVGLVWGIWHCAIAVGPVLRASLEGTLRWDVMLRALATCAQCVASSIALSFIFGAVWLKSRSIFLSSFLHGYWIGMRDAASNLLSYPAVFRLITLVVVLAAWGMADRWLARYERSEQPVAKQ